MENDKYLYQVNGIYSESFHVVQTDALFLLTLHLRALILLDPDTDSSYCDAVDSSTVVTLRSNVGLDPNDPIDQAYIESAGIDIDNSYYTNCIIQSCFPPIAETLMSDEEMISSRAKQWLQAGIPRFNNGDSVWPDKHAKQIVIKEVVAGAEILLHTMYVVIQGKPVESSKIYSCTTEP